MARRKILGSAIVILLAWMAWGQDAKPTPAQDPQKPKPPPGETKFVVTATRTEQDLSNIPQSVTIVTPEEIQRRQARTPNQMLREEPGVWSPQVNAQGSPIIRGMIGNRVIYLWDGIRINNGALFSGPNGFFNQFPIGAVDRMEVIRGPGSVQYGSDAMGGVVNLLSKPPRAFTGELEYGGGIYARYGTVDQEKTGYVDLWASNSDFSAMVGATGQDVNDYIGPHFGTLSPTGYEALGGFANFSYRVAQNQKLTLSWIGNRRDDVDTYTQSKLNPSGIPRIFGPFEDRTIVKLGHELETPAPWLKELKSYAYYQVYNQARDNITETTTQLRRTTTKTDQEIYGLGTQAAFPFKLVGDDQLIAGVDYRLESLRSEKTLYTTTKSTGSIAVSTPAGNTPDGIYDVFDAFMIAEFMPGESFLLSFGVRFETTHLDSSPSQEDALTPFTVQDLTLDKRWDSFTWSTGAVYWFTKEFSAAASVASGFRAPTYSDTLSTGVPVFASGIASVPSPNIDPERSITYEASLRIESPTWHVVLTGYYTQLLDLLVNVPAGNINVPGIGVVQARARSNDGEGYITGCEVGAACLVAPEWTIFANLTYTFGQDTANDVPLRFIPPLNGLVGLRWESEPKRWWAEAVVVMADQLRRHAPDDEIDAGFSQDPAFGSPSATNPPLRDFRIAGYVVVNLRGGVQIWKKEGGSSLSLTVDINNALDMHYREAYSQQQREAPGIGVVVGAEIKY